MKIKNLKMFLKIVNNAVSLKKMTENDFEISL